MKIEKFDRNKYGVNTYIIYDEDTKDTVIIDPGLSYNAIVDFVEQNELNPLAILLTHGHIDHIADADLVRKKYNIDLYVHQLGDQMLTEPEMNLSPHFGYKDFYLEADKFFKDKDILVFGTLKFEVIHTPGHSQDCVTFVIEDALFTGDTLFRGSMGRVDLPSSNPEHMNASLNKLKNLEGDYKVYPGHSGNTTLENERAINPFLKNL